VGRLEVWYIDRWGTVCGHEFDYIDAGVVCQSWLRVRIGYWFGTVSFKYKYDDASNFSKGMVPTFSTFPFPPFPFPPIPTYLSSSLSLPFLVLTHEP